MPRKEFKSAACDTIYTIYLPLCIQPADPNPFQGTHCIFQVIFAGVWIWSLPIIPEHCQLIPRIMPMCICFSTGGSVSKQSRLLFDLHTYEHKIEELYTITVHPYFDCIFSEYLYWRKLYVYLFHWYIISRVTYSFMKMVPSVYTRLMKAGSSSQC